MSEQEKQDGLEEATFLVGGFTREEFLGLADDEPDEDMSFPQPKRSIWKSSNKETSS